MLYTFLFLHHSDGYGTNVQANTWFDWIINETERLACIESSSKSSDRNKRGRIGSIRFELLIMILVPFCLSLSLSILYNSPRNISHSNFSCHRSCNWESIRIFTIWNIHCESSIFVLHPGYQYQSDSLQWTHWKFEFEANIRQKRCITFNNVVCNFGRNVDILVIYIMILISITNQTKKKQKQTSLIVWKFHWNFR